LARTEERPGVQAEVISGGSGERASYLDERGGHAALGGSADVSGSREVRGQTGRMMEAEGIQGFTKRELLRLSSTGRGEKL